MSKGRDSNFDGSYETSRAAKDSLEDSIARLAFDDKQSAIWSESDGGRGTIKENIDTDRVDYWLQNTPGGDDYMHAWYDPSTGDKGYRDADGNTHEGCYLTTACIKHLSKSFDDNCHELTVLRWFRDHFVKENDIALYYKVAPLIVKKIDTLPSDKQNRIYDFIYKEVVSACVRMIENKQYGDAYERYMRSTLALQQQFCQ